MSGHDAGGSRNPSAPLGCSRVTREGCRGLVHSMPSSSKGTHPHPCPAPPWEHISICSLLLCRGTSPSVLLHRDTSPSMPCSAAGHVLVPQPVLPRCRCGLHPSHPAPPPALSPCCLPRLFCDSAPPEAGRGSPGVEVLVCHHFPTVPCLVLRPNSRGKGLPSFWCLYSALRCQAICGGPKVLSQAVNNVLLFLYYYYHYYLHTSSVRLCF